MSKIQVQNTGKRILATHVDGEIFRFVPGEATVMEQAELTKLQRSPSFQFMFDSKELVSSEYIEPKPAEAPKAEPKLDNKRGGNS